jgi:hypothetical protein
LGSAWQVSIESLAHFKKHLSPTNSTLEGIEIDESAEQCEKADLSIRTSFASGSTVTDERSSHPVKAPSPMTSTDEGMQIGESE